VAHIAVRQRRKQLSS